MTIFDHLLSQKKATRIAEMRLHGYLLFGQLEVSLEGLPREH